MIQMFKRMFGFEKKDIHEVERKTILTVEDNDVDIRLIKSILEKKYNVITAENGEVGLEMIRKHKPDLVVLDCEMPVMTGNEMCKIMKNDNDLKEIPVLFLTSINTPKNIIECFELDAENHLSKPINSNVLLGQVDAILLGYETT
ncbi:MAG: response regulator [Candidatus Omnitrophica bacterium]|nr:response regulator [Candidatus Omnitrophota bacterium]MBU1997056.1 response regulator [Candidatus Omnitrophota bacterium]MBU4333660.1 response regulator [Candidatus Omnitrophota bacterium]